MFDDELPDCFVDPVTSSLPAKKEPVEQQLSDHDVQESPTKPSSAGKRAKHKRSDSIRVSMEELMTNDCWVKERLVFQKVWPFYEKSNYLEDIVDKYAPEDNKHRDTKLLSLRRLDAFVSTLGLKMPLVYRLSIAGEPVLAADVSANFKGGPWLNVPVLHQLMTAVYGRGRIGIFRRGPCFYVTKQEKKYLVCPAQLNWFRWAIENGIIRLAEKYFRSHLGKHVKEQRATSDKHRKTGLGRVPKQRVVQSLYRVPQPRSLPVSQWFDEDGEDELARSDHDNESERNNTGG